MYKKNVIKKIVLICIIIIFIIGIGSIIWYKSNISSVVKSGEGEKINVEITDGMRSC